MKYIKTKAKILPLAIALGLSGTMVGCNENNSEHSGDQSSVKDDAYYRQQAEEMLSKLSLSEKLDLVSGPGIDIANRMPYPTINIQGEHLAGVGYINGVNNDDIDIPAVVLDDGPAGLKIAPIRDGRSGTTYATAWPIATQLASTWDPGLVAEVGKAMGEETKEYGIDVLLTPGMNIQRNPLTGRNFEYYSEDPLVSGEIAAAMVNGIESNGVGASVKHFFGNESETNRDFVDVIGDPRTFREIYLRGFEIAVKKSQPWTVMSSYNKVNGTYVDQRKDAITDILRGEWGFNGLVMSDWFAGNALADPDAAANMMKAGNDLVEPGGVKHYLESSIEAGELTEDIVNERVINILTQVQKTPSYQHYEISANPDLISHAELARTAGAEGMVLLKNSDDVLPLAADTSLASFGVGQLGTYKGGTGSGNVFSEYVINIADGLQSVFPIDSNVLNWYENYYDSNKVAHYDSWGPISHYTYDEPTITGNSELESIVSAAASDNNVAIITISRQAGESADRTYTKGDYLLNDAELDMIDSVSNSFHAQGKSVVVVLNVGGVIDVSSWSDKVDAILLAYMGGQEIGYEVADILSGSVNPSGKLTQTFPVAYTDVPSSSTFPGIDTTGDSVPDEIYYNEGIYVGYRYYSSFDVPVAYPFGYGLSYTTFAYENSSVSSNTLAEGADGSIEFTTTIVNNGEYSGKEVAQVYITAPEVKLKKPTIELKAFAKTSELAVGESETLTFTVPAKMLASFDPENNQWIVEPGTYLVYISPSSDVAMVDPISFRVNEEIVVSNTTPGAIALPDGVDISSFITVTE